ncbi:MAG: carboxypeptidase regulatory-like domain-containing protein [Prosthecobacter sp.]|nr:carboxypeptidase regulatory-like domain-containing protein [Prosthecobacter sp.]
MLRVKRTVFGKAPLAALATVLLYTLPSCGKPSIPSGSSVTLAPATEIAMTSSLTGKVILAGGRPSSLGKVIDVGGNPFCTGHPQLVSPAWRVAADGGLADVVISVRRSSRASNGTSEPALIDQKHCEFAPYMTVLQAGQSVRFHNSDLTFHNIRIIRHEAGTRDGGRNLDNFGQPAQGDENLKAFGEPGLYRLECDVHRWMKAWVFVHEGSHAAATGADGTFAINRALADGEYEVEAWHPQFAEKLSQAVTVHGGKASVNFEFALAKSLEP